VTAADLLPELRRRGVILTADGNRIVYRAPKGTLTPELREAVVRFKGEILGILRVSNIEDEAPPVPCMSPNCAGCYEVRAGVRLHPPKPSQDWKDWLARWQPDGAGRIQ